MLDYQRIVDNVRSALFNNGQDGDEFLQSAAADYALAVDEANERLRKCGPLLRKGLRSEAIQLCEIEPNLLDVVGILDFPERDSWKELLALHGLASPAALMLDVAANLNEAYAVEQPLATLLQRHRLLAMSRAPLKLRVETLRRLADADPENPIWDQDLRTFETERVKELQQEVPQAIARGDATVLEALSDELESFAWRIEKPDALIEQISAAKSKAARQEGLGELRCAADRLNGMYTASDVEGARGAKTAWEALLAQWGDFADPALSAGVADALGWLGEQEKLAAQAARHEAAVADLDHALTTGRPVGELHRLYREAKRSGKISPRVEKRYRERLAAVDRAGRRSVRLAAAVVAVFVLAVAAVIAVVVYQNIKAGKVERDFAALQQLINYGNFDEARKLIEQLPAESAADPRIQEIGSRLKKQQKEMDAQRGAFATQMGLVQKALDDKFPNDEADDALAAARAAAKTLTEEDRAVVRKADMEYAELKKSLGSKVDQEFLAQLKKLEDRVDAIEKNIKDEPDACKDKLNHLSVEMTKLVASNSQISDTAKNHADALRTRVKGLIDEPQKFIDMRKREDTVTEACGDNAAFRQRLLDYADKFPQAKESASYRTVAGDEAPLWDWIGQWNEDAVKKIGRQNSTRFKRKEAKDLADKLRKLLDGRPGHPDADAFKERLPFLDAVVQRSDGDGNPIEWSLKEVFNDLIAAGTWMLTDTAGHKYYLLEDPAAKFTPLKADRSYGFEYFTGADLTKQHKGQKSLFGSDIKPGGFVAPQQVTVKALLAILEGVNDDQWEPSFCSMIETVMNDHQTDPLLRHFLLRKILDVGCKGSLWFQKAFGRYKELLDATKVPDGVNWVDPNDAVAVEQRPVAEAELDKLPSFSDVQKSAFDDYKRLGGPIGTEYTCVGWLKNSGSWQCATKSGCPETGKLVVIRPAEAGQNAKAVFDPVGELRGAKAVIEAHAGPALVEGRPVFVAKPPTK